MKPRSYSHVFAILVCVLALFVAQTFGGQRGYVCQCGGKPMVTQASHCHGPHGQECHTEGAQIDASHSEKDSGPREEHQVVSQDVRSRPAEAAPQVTAPQLSGAILPTVEILFARHELKVQATNSVDFAESPPFGVAVAHTIVLLI